MIVTQSTADALQALYDYCFNLNSYTDNQYGWLDIKAMVKTAEWWHHGYAHFWTGDSCADGIGKYMIELGIRPSRGANPANTYDYNNFIELFSDAYDEIVRFKEAVYNAIDIADKNRDINARTFLEDFITNTITPVIHQIEVIKAKAIELEDKPAKFDKYFESFIIWGSPEL